MRPRYILTAASVFLGLTGIMLLFLPEATSGFITGEPASEAAGQLISAGFLAMAVLNWMGRGAVYGGIYGRPLILANFLFGFILGTTTLRAALQSGGSLWLTAVYGAIHTAVFAWMMTGRSPSTDDRRPAS